MITEACLVGPSNESEVDDFLSQCKPSANSLSSGPWYWVRLPQAQKGAEDSTSKPAEEKAGGDDVYAAFEAEGQELVEALTEQCAHIKVTAPTRGNKKQGIKSQKELREAEYEKFNTAVEKLAMKHKILTGKWLFYSSSDIIDFTWSKIVKALALPEGSLAKTGSVHTAKVSSTASNGEQSVICVYCDDSWDREGVEKAFRALVHEEGLVSSAYKCDANTLLGIDSKHPSGIRSSLYGKTTFMTQAEIDAAFESKTKKKEVKKKTLEQELEGGAGDGFDPVSENEEEEEERPRKKVAKKAKK
ncbi:hypothetical protein JCM11641_002505 [Rhodosporidiobolus odoratus]